MNISDEINRRLSNCVQQGMGPQRREDIEGLVHYIENVAYGRLEDLTEFIDALDELGSEHPLQELEVIQEIVEEYDDLEFAIRSANGFLTTYSP